MRILDELGEELVRAARAAEAEPAYAQQAARGRRRPLVRVPRTVLISLASLLLLAAAAVAATLVIGRGDPIPPAPAGAVPRELRPVPGTERLSHLDVADPDGGPAWDIRISRSTTGAVCMAVGQLLEGQLGIVGLDRRFRALPTGAADTCSTPQRIGATLASARAYRGAADPSAAGAVHDLTAIAGVAAPAVQRVTVVAGGRRIPVRLADGGAFLALVSGLPEQLRPRVVLTDGSGRATTLRFADTGEYLAPDPTGGTPWTLRARGGPPPPPPCGTRAPPRSPRTRTALRHRLPRDRPRLTAAVPWPPLEPADA
jgi:hypothetical protein